MFETYWLIQKMPLEAHHKRYAVTSNHQAGRSHSASLVDTPFAVNCCQLADEDQWFVPFKDEGDYRHYLCGKWPNTDHVIQKISKSKLKLESDS